MEYYHRRRGVVLVEIENAFLLVSDKEARNYCPYIAQVNEIGAYIWKHLHEETTLEDLLHLVSAEYNTYDRNSESLRVEVSSFIEQLCKSGLLLCKNK